MADLADNHCFAEVSSLRKQPDDQLTIVYYLPCNPSSLYVNVTDKCLNSCLFCIRREGPLFYGSDLSLHGRELGSQEISRALAASIGWAFVQEVVVCGMGEPLLRYDCVEEVCDWIRQQKGDAVSIRVDTSGLFWSQTCRLSLLDRIDVLSVSLNAEAPEKYEALCQPKIEGAYEILVEFLGAVKAWENNRRLAGCSYPQVRLSVVDTSEEEYIPASGRKGYGSGTFPVPDIEKCKKIAASFNWPLVVKRLFRDSTHKRWSNPDVLALCARGVEPEACRGCSFRH